MEDQDTASLNTEVPESAETSTVDFDDTRSWVTVTDSAVGSPGPSGRRAGHRPWGGDGDDDDDIDALSALRRINRRRRWVVLRSRVAVDVHSMRVASRQGNDAWI